jgi:hypothetical protein
MASSSVLLSVSVVSCTTRRFLRGALSVAGAMGAFLFIGTIARGYNTEVDCKGGDRSALVLLRRADDCSDERLIPVRTDPENLPS